MKQLLFVLLITTSSFLNAQCNLVSTANATTVDCYGDCDGVINYLFQNTGSPGAPYIVTLINETTGQTISSTTYTNEFESIVFTGLCAGNYSIYAQGISCSDQIFAQVIQPTELQLNINTIDPGPGQSNGSATIIASGGTPGYTYSLDGINYQPSNTFTGLSEGVYIGYVKDANDCVAFYTFLLNDIGNCNMVVTANSSIASCANNCDAIVQYYFTGNQMNGPFTVELYNNYNQVVQTQNGNGYQGVFQNVCAGIYTVQVTDANGCTGSYTLTIAQASAPVITGVTTTNSAYGTTTGTATFNVSGGTAPYEYSLDGVTYQSNNTFTGLAAGFYIGYVVDANGCTSLFCFIVDESTACTLVLTSMSTNAGCYGNNGGSITYTYTNGVGPVTIVLQEVNGATVQSTTDNNGASQGVFQNVPAGSYYVIVTDATGCSYTNNVIVNGPLTPLNVTVATTDPTFGSSNGSITITASGGTAPYTYSIDNGQTWQTSNTFSNLGQGVYIIMVEDANGCSYIYCVQLVQVTNCPQVITATAIPVSCAGMSDGEIDYAFTSDGSAAPFVVEVISGNNTIQTASYAGAGASGTFSNLPSGVYLVTLTGANGCTSTTQVYIDEPDPLAITNVAVTDATLGNSDGSATVSVSGGTAPYTYSLNAGASGSSNTFTGLSAGIQILTVADANGCSTTYCFMVNESTGCQPLAITLSELQSITCTASCNGVLGFVYTSGGAPGTYVVELAQYGNVLFTQTFIQSANQGFFPNVCWGDYSVTVTDPNGCSATVNYTMSQPEMIVLTATTSDATAGSANGTITAIASGGTGNYTYSIDNGSTWQSSNVFSGLSAGTYIVYVSDDNGCTAWYTVILNDASTCTMTITANVIPGSGCAASCSDEIVYTYTNSGGTAPFLITLTDQNGNTWTQTQTTANGTGSFTGLCAGVYIVTVQDANGCEAVYTIQIVGYGNMTINVSTIDPTIGMADGAIDVVVAGGLPTYQYSIDNQVNWTPNATFSNLAAGVYLVYTKDQNECTQVTSAKLGQSTATLNELSHDVAVYPNPTKDKVIIEGLGIQSLELYSIDGAKLPVRAFKMTNGYYMDLNALSTGVYVAVIHFEHGSENVRVVKE